MIYYGHGISDVHMNSEWLPLYTQLLCKIKAPYRIDRLQPLLMSYWEVIAFGE